MKSLIKRTAIFSTQLVVVTAAITLLTISYLVEPKQ